MKNENNKRKRRILMFILLPVITVLLLIMIYFMIPYSPLQSDFNKKVSALISNHKKAAGLFSEEDLTDLPEPVKNYFKTSGFIGTPKMSYMKVTYKNVDFLLSPDKPYTKIDYTQYNFVTEPTRLAFIDTNMFGVPFQGVDSYVDGVGSMKGVLGKSFTLFNQMGTEMNTSCIINTLSECLFMPSIALQDYITWESMDNTHAKGTISYYGLSASGIFTFSETGELLSFTTNDRWSVETNGEKINAPWSIQLDDYQVMNGIKLPTDFKAVWHYDKGDSVYFDSNHAEIEYF